MKRLVKTLRKESTDRVPFWFMRQAGRYLPEYKALRSTANGFLDFCYTPEKASEATLQPIKRFGMDGAIIFSDILVIPHALGMNVRFEEGHGPVLVPVKNEKDLAAFTHDNLKTHLAPVYEALKITKEKLPDETALIGFAGAPWTLACYSVEGHSSKDFAGVITIAEQDPAFFEKLLDHFEKAVAQHLKNQVEAGAEILQIFDSWAGVLNEAQFAKWVIAPTKRIVAEVKKQHPNIPIIGFPRQSGEKIASYVKQTGVDAVSFDQSVSLSWVKENLQPHCTVQGCLNQILLAEDKEAMLKETQHIIASLDKPFVFNLSHGILPHTPPENMQALCDYLRSA